MSPLIARSARPAAILTILGLALLSACAPRQTATPYEISTPSSTNAGNPSQVAGSGELPPLPVVQMEGANGPEYKLELLDAVNEDLRVVVRSIAQSFGLDYRIDPAVDGRVTTRLTGVTLRDALDAVVLPAGYVYQLEGNVLRVMPAGVTTRIFSLNYIAMSRTGVSTTIVQRRLGSGQNLGGQFNNNGTLGGGGADFIQSVTVSDLWDEIRVSLEGIVFDAAQEQAVTETVDELTNPLNRGRVVGAPDASSNIGEDGRRVIINPLAGTILVAAPPDKLAQVEAFISAIEASIHRQVLVEAKIVEVSLNDSHEFGIDWNIIQQIGDVGVGLTQRPGHLEFTLAPGGPSVDSRITVVLKALEQQGDVKVVASPRLSVMNNQPAVFNMTTDQVFFTVTQQPIIGPSGGTIGFTTEVQPEQVSVGIVLELFAQISADNTITMNVRPAITSVVAETSITLSNGTQATAPVVDRRETDTVVRVRDGETIVIGGLVQSTQRENESGIPILRDIPLIGGLFGGFSSESSQRELVIFITPTIVAGQPSIAG